MKISAIQHTIKSLALLLTTLVVLASCMSDAKTSSSPKCAITAFSVASIKSEVPSKKYDSHGNATDTVVTKTITGSTIFFNINQVERHIYNVDSLPKWVDLTAVTPSFSSDGDVYANVDEEEDVFYPIISGSSTIDMSKTVKFMCISTDGTSHCIYKVDIYKHLQNTDTLEWNAVESNLNVMGEAKSFATGDKVYVFAKDNNGADIVTYASQNDAANWSTPAPISVASASVVLFGDQFYGLDNDGYIYRAAVSQDAATWEKVSNQQVKSLLAADAYYLYAFDGNNILGTSDFSNWSSQGMTDLNMLPETPISAISHASSTNNELQMAVMAGSTENNPNNGVVWYKTTSTDPAINQPWAYIQVTIDNDYGMPAFEHPSMTYYQDALFAIGMVDGKYGNIYRSDDNGITWHEQTSLYMLPAELNSEEGMACLVTVGDKLWLIQTNGNLWQGSIR